MRLHRSMIFVLFLLSNIVYGQKTERFDSLFQSLYEHREFNGNVLIADEGKVIFEKSYGMADELQKSELNGSTMFELASVSKQFTAVGIVLLHKKGKLNYDDKLSKFLPELTFYGNITIENLLNHTSGLPDYSEVFAGHWDENKIATNHDLVNQLIAYKPNLEFQPGERFKYSNTGYALLAEIIEKVSGKSFGAFLDENIFQPLHMNRTKVYSRIYRPQTIENYASGYVDADDDDAKTLADDLVPRSEYYFLDGIVGAGRLKSTVEDLLKWDRALYTNAIIDEEDKDLIFTSGKTNDGKEIGYGFGWFLSKESEIGKIASHSGGWAGYISYIERDLDRDKTIILLQNNSLKNSTIPVNEIHRILYDIQTPQPTQAQLVSYAGRYTMDNGKDFKVELRNGKLVSDVVADTYLDLIPLSPTKFILTGFSPSVYLEFKTLRDMLNISILTQPESSMKMVGIKGEDDIR